MYLLSEWRRQARGMITSRYVLDLVKEISQQRRMVVGFVEIHIPHIYVNHR